MALNNDPSTLIFTHIYYAYQGLGVDNDAAVRESRETYDVYFLGIVPDINMGNSWSRDKEAQLVDRVEEAQVA